MQLVLHNQYQLQLIHLEQVKYLKKCLLNLFVTNFDLRPAGIIKMLDLRRPIYKQTAAYGHFGRTDIDLPWEQTDKAEELKKQANI